MADESIIVGNWQCPIEPIAIVQPLRIVGLEFSLVSESGENKLEVKVAMSDGALKVGLIPLTTVKDPDSPGKEESWPT